MGIFNSISLCLTVSASFCVSLSHPSSLPPLPPFLSLSLSLSSLSPRSSSLCLFLIHVPSLPLSLPWLSPYSSSLLTYSLLSPYGHLFLSVLVSLCVAVFVPNCVTVLLSVSVSFTSFLPLPPPILLAVPVINRQNGNSPAIHCCAAPTLSLLTPDAPGAEDLGHSGSGWWILQRFLWRRLRSPSSEASDIMNKSFI